VRVFYEVGTAFFPTFLSFRNLEQLMTLVQQEADINADEHRKKIPRKKLYGISHHFHLVVPEYNPASEHSVDPPQIKVEAHTIIPPYPFPCSFHF
jgi:hypothetical protein